MPEKLLTKAEFIALWRRHPIRVTLYFVWGLPLMFWWFVEGFIEGVRERRS